MAIGLVRRLGRLVKADAHGIVESLEDRALLLKQHLREAELEIQRKRARAEALADEERRLQEDAARLAGALESAERDTQLALAQDREDLARFAIRRLLPLRTELAALRARDAEVAEERTRLDERRSEQETRLEELRARVRSHVAEHTRAVRSESDLAVPGVADEEVEMELLRRRQAGGGSL